MAKFGTTFDASQYDTEQRDFDNLPNGIYRMEISAADIKPPNDKGNVRLEYTMEVIEPEDFKGRKLFGGINIENPSAQTQEIGQKELASLCRASGLVTVDDTDELLYQPFVVKVMLGKDSKDKNADGSPKYPARAEVKKYFFPDQGNVPEPAVDTPPANDNRRPAPAAANNNRAASQNEAAKPAAAAGGATKANPWKKS